MAIDTARLGHYRPDRVLSRLVSLLGPTIGAAGQSLTALAFNSVTSFAAGAMLVTFDSTWRQYPPLLVMVPAAIGLRGNVFSTMGSRLSTAIHTGEYRRSFARDSVLGQNLLSAFALTFTLSVLLAFFAKAVAVAVGVRAGLGVMELVVVSVVGGLGASMVVAFTTVILTMGAVRNGWDLDNLVAPTVSTVGDVVTIPALWAAAKLVGVGDLTSILGPVMVGVAVGIIVVVRRSSMSLLRRIYAESIPVLGGALLLSTFAGVVLEKQLSTLALVPAVLVLQPSFVSSAGAMGSMLAGRVATNLHIGLAEPTAVPGPEFRRDVTSIAGLAGPVLVINTTGAWLTSRGLPAGSGPGFLWLFAVGLLAAAVTMTFVAAVSYYSTIGAWRIDVDPDSYGSPLVTASVDFVGTMALVLAVTILALA